MPTDRIRHCASMDWHLDGQDMIDAGVEERGGGGVMLPLGGWNVEGLGLEESAWGASARVELWTND